MNAIDYVAIVLAWYLLVGGFRLYSDFSPPKFKRPMYAMTGDVKMAVSVFSLWPIAGIRMLMLENRFTGKSVLGKLFLSCTALCALLIAVAVSYIIAGRVTENTLIQFVLTFPITWLIAWLFTKAVR